MQSEQEKLANFAHTVLSSAQKQKEETILQMEKEAKQRLEEQKQEMARRLEAETKQETDRISASFQAEVQKKQTALKKDLLEARQRRIEGIFQKVTGRLAEYRNTPAYRQNLQEEVERAKQSLGGEDVTVFLDSTDPAAAFLREKGEKVEPYPLPMLGGCIVACQQKRLQIDKSFDLRVEEEKKRFLERYELTIEKR